MKTPGFWPEPGFPAQIVYHEEKMEDEDNDTIPVWGLMLVFTIITLGAAGLKMGGYIDVSWWGVFCLFELLGFTLGVGTLAFFASRLQERWCNRETHREFKRCMAHIDAANKGEKENSK